MVDNFAGQPPRSTPTVEQPANRAPGNSQVTGGGNTLLPNADGSINADTTPVLPSAGTLTNIVINATANGDNTILAGVADTTIKVYQLTLGAASVAVDAVFKSGSTDISGAMTLSTNSPLVLTFSPYPWLLTGTADDLILNLSTTASVGGFASVVQS